MRERELIARLLRPLASGEEALGLRDDAALLEMPHGMALATSTDMLVAGVHFLACGAPEDIAYKALGVNLSDMAAMGARPYCYQLALGLSGSEDDAWLERFCTALGQAQQSGGVRLSGGDTVRGCATLTLSITMHGLVPADKALRRSGAHAGDALYVSGALGDAAAGLLLLTDAPHGLRMLDEGAREVLCARYWRPTPRIALGEALHGVATACMDISDGLWLDAIRLCEASSVGARIHHEALPLCDALQSAVANMPELAAYCPYAGDDYELLFTAPDTPEMHDELVALSQRIGVAISRIGDITPASDGVELLHRGEAFVPATRGYEH